MATFLGSIFVFLLVIALHEFGHFIVAKAVGVRVNEFSIGMGPSIYNKQKGETQYSIRALPIGGYVAMEGEEENSNDPRSFGNVSVGRRMAVVLAGAAMNFVLAYIAFTLASLIIGFPTTTVDQVFHDSPAEQAGIMPGDRIVSIDDHPISEWNDIVDNIGDKTDQMQVKVEREGVQKSFELQPTVKDGQSIIGISPKNKIDVLESFKSGFTLIGVTIGSIFSVFGLIFSGQFSMDMLAGPVGVVQVIGQSASAGFGSLIFILGFISANLGFMNLLPIPALDGGKMVFLAIEGIRGRPISEKIEMTLSMIGITLLFGLMIYVTIFSDIARIINN